jgi:hypothetical protein
MKPADIIRAVAVAPILSSCNTTSQLMVEALRDSSHNNS